MQKIIVFLICVLLFVIKSYSQQYGIYDSLSRNRAKHILNTCLKDEIKDLNLLLFSSGDIAYLVITERDSNYMAYYLLMDTIEHRKSLETFIIDKPNNILSVAFDTTQYHSGYITFNSDFYKEGYTKAWGTNTYFIFKTKNGHEYGECRLSVIVDPNPINKDVYYYLQTKLVTYINEYHNRTAKNKKKNRLRRKISY